MLEGDAEFLLEGECDRCLSETQFTVSFHIEREIEDCKGVERSSDDENADVLILESPYYILNLLYSYWVNAGKRFI